MYSVFSNYLTPLGVNCDEAKPSEVYNQLRIAYNQGATGIIDNTRVFASVRNDEVDYEIVYEIWDNEYLRDLLRWVNKKIILNLGLADYRTIGVRMRIAIGILNKLVSEEKVTSKIGYKIHDNFVTTINDEFSAINTEDLPF